VGLPYELRGRVIAPTGLPISGAEVRHRPSPATLAAAGVHPSPFVTDEPFPWDELPRTTTDAQGRFAFTVRELPRKDQPGRTEIKPGGGSFAPPVMNVPSLVVLAAGFGATQHICLDFASADLDVGDIVLVPGAALAGRVVDEQGGPLADVRVTPTPGPEPPGTENMGDWHAVVSTFDTRSGEGGRFRLDSLWQGKLTLRFEAPGFAPLDRDFEFVAGDVQDAGDVVLDRGGRITGVVVDSARQPLAGAWIKARVAIGHDLGGGDSVAYEAGLRIFGKNIHEISTTADGSGAFAVETLNQPAYDLFVGARGYELLKLSQVATGTRDLVVELTPEATALLTVVDATSGQPVTGATATATRHATSDTSDTYGHDSDIQVLAGAKAAQAAGGELPPDGLLLVLGLGTQRNTVLVKAAGYGTTSFELPGVVAPDRIRQTLELPREAVVTGRALDDRGAPVAGAIAGVEPPANVLLPFSPREKADVEGRFRIAALAPGEWTLRASSTGYVRSEPRALTLLAGHELDAGDIVLTRGGRITGLVVDADGRPAVAADVGAERLEPAAPAAGAGAAAADSRRRTTIRVATDPKGRFTFEALAAGRYAVTCEPGAQAEVEVVAGADADVTLQLRRRPRVHGRVTDSAGPVADAEVFAQVQMALGFLDDSETRSSPAGAYELEFYTPGTYRVRAADGGEATAARRVTLQWGDDLVVDLPFGGERLEGFVVAADGGAPIAGATIILFNLTPATVAPRDDDESRQFQVEADAEGRFEARRLWAGPHRVEARAQGFATATLGPIDVPRPEGAAPLRLELAPEASVRGVVKTTAGTAVPREIKVVAVGEDVLAPDGTPFEAKFGVELDGSYHGDGLRAGSYRLQVRRRTSAPGETAVWEFLTEQRVTLAAGRATVVDFLITL
jgi:hypothetical protein